MTWPWSQDRASSTVSSPSSTTAGSGGLVIAPRKLAAAEAGASLYGRALSAARVSPAVIAGIVSPSVLRAMGRAIILDGEAVFSIEGGRRNGDPIRLEPLCGHQVRGVDSNPSTWTYEGDLVGPEGFRHVVRNVDQIIHVTWSRNQFMPWIGEGPFSNASDSMRLAYLLERKLGDEVSGPVGSLLPTALADPNNHATFRKDLSKLAGEVSLVESSRSMADTRSSAPARDWMTTRIGAAVPASLVELRQQLSIAVYSLLGIPLTLIREEGSGSRESYRRFVHVSVAPIAKGIEHELSAKFDQEVRLNLTDLQSSDVAGRARAFKGLIEAGMKLEDAAALSGLLLDDDA